jgi:hypothetical protein
VLLAGLESAVRETREALERVDGDEMLRERRIQGFDVTGWNALFHCIPHFKGHTQEIICLTRMQLKNTYRFHWQPKTPEQGGSRRTNVTFVHRPPIPDAPTLN